MPAQGRLEPFSLHSRALASLPRLSEAERGVKTSGLLEAFDKEDLFFPSGILTFENPDDESNLNTYFSF